MSGAGVPAQAEGPLKPRLRGVSHQYAYFVSLACGVGLILAASGGRARVAAAIYAGAVSALLGTSALYHRVTWRGALFKLLWIDLPPSAPCTGESVETERDRPKPGDRARSPCPKRLAATPATTLKPQSDIS